MQGIYIIRNRETNDFYLGSSVDIESRFKNHLLELRGNRHCNRYLQNAWNKYGEDSFEFKCIDEVGETRALREVEQSYLDTLLPTYNLSPFATRPPGYPGDESHFNTPRARARHREVMQKKRGIPRTEEVKGRIREGDRLAREEGRFPHHLGQKRSDESRLRMAESQKKFWNSEEGKLARKRQQLNRLKRSSEIS